MKGYSQREEGRGRGSPPWGILVVVLVAGMAAPSTVFKVPPLIPIMMADLNMTGTTAGLLMSIFSVSGLLVSLPAGIIFRRFGSRVALFSMAFLVLGSGLGSFCESAAPLLGTRFIEGIGVSLIGVAGPAIVSNRFHAKDRATALGIWLMYVPLGTAMSFGLAPFFASHWGWESVWWAASLYALCAGVLYAFFVRPVREEAPAEPHGADPKADLWSGLRHVLSNRDLWLFSLLYCSFAMVFTSFLGWTPTYLFTVRHESLAFASTLVGLVPVVGIVGSPLAGWVLGRTHSIKTLMILPMALFSFTGPLTLFLGADLLLPFVIVVGLIAAFVPTSLAVVAARAVRDNESRGIAMAVISIGFNSGSLLGPFIFGYALDHLGGWAPAFWIFLPLGLAGAAAALPARDRLT